jgi:anti-sigma B factor antagonist
MTHRQPATSEKTSASGRLNTVRVDEHGGAAVVAIRGRIDAGTAPLIRDALAWAVSCYARVVVDLSAADYIDRSGLSVIIAAQDHASHRAVHLCLSAPSPQLLAALCRMRAGETLTTADALTHRAEAAADDEAEFTLPQVRNPLLFDIAAA